VGIAYNVRQLGYQSIDYNVGHRVVRHCWIIDEKQILTISS
jgi:hypothetical protein